MPSRSLAAVGMEVGPPSPLLDFRLQLCLRCERRLVRVDGIEPTTPAWKAGVLPLNYTRFSKAHQYAV